MREIKFRGLNAKNEWRYGYLLKDSEGETTYYDEYSYRIVWYEGHAHCNQPVKNGTIGQFTGLKDKNGVEIYEGDIIEQGAMLFKIEYNIKVIGFVLVPIREYVFDYMPVNVENHLPGQVIGNIYENKELLGE